MHLTLISVLFASALAVGCNDAESIRLTETQAKLVGAWLFESEAEGLKVRRVLTLDGKGTFSERLALTSSEGRVETLEYAGEWSYDGTYLKRRFLQENGRQYSGGKIRFATFPLVAVSAKEMVVDDNIQKRQVAFSRVAEGMRP